MNNTQRHYSRSLRALHWLMAVLLFSQLFMGATMVARVDSYAVLVGLHKILGLILLGLVCLRLGVRLITTAPALPSSVPQGQRRAAHSLHALLYLLMLAQPLCGWLMLSAAGQPLTFLGWVVPSLINADSGLYVLLRSLHGLLAYLLFALMLLHVGAALVHGLIRRDGVLERMLKTTPPEAHWD